MNTYSNTLSESKSQAAANSLGRSAIQLKDNRSVAVIQRGAASSRPVPSEQSYVQVNLSGKGRENPMGHSSASISHNGQLTEINTEMVGDGYQVVTEDPVNAMRGKTNAKYKVVVRGVTGPSSSSSFSVRVPISSESATHMIERANGMNGHTESWNATRNCTTPVKQVLRMRQGVLFNTPSGTLVNMWLRKTKNPAMLAATGGLAAYWAYSQLRTPEIRHESKEEKKDQ